MVPRDLLGLAIVGTEPFIGRSAQLAPELESMTYLENAFGGSYAITKDLTVGARFKLLKGVTSITTENSLFSLTLDDSYNMTVQGSLDTRTSGINELDTVDFDPAASYRRYRQNNGFALDVGATYRLFDRLTVGASLTDMGSIKWRNDTYNYSLDPAKANYTFRGIDINQVVNNEATLQADLDSLEQKFVLDEKPMGAYRSPLPGKAYLSGVYEVRRNFTAGMVLAFEKFRGRFSPALTLGANKHFGRRMSAAVSYTIASRSANNLGLGWSLNLPPFQFYVVGDNLLRLPLTLATRGEINSYVNSMQYFNMRLGINWVWGWSKPQEKRTDATPKQKWIDLLFNR
jgi:hypothetical protein